MKSQPAEIRTGPRAVSALGTLAAALLGCGSHPPPATAPVVVVALPVHPQVRDGADTPALPAEVAARYTNVTSFRIAGKLIERDVRLGDSVSRGQVLARLDPSDARQQATSAQAAFDAAKHRLAFAQQQLDRDSAQAAQNLIAAAQLEQTQDAYTAALDAREQAATQWAVAQNNLQYNTLRADHDGLITSENADTGQVVVAGQAVYGLAWSGDTDVTIDAPEGRLAAISIGQHARVRFPALPNRDFDARVREISPAADPQSRTYRVKLSLIPPNREVHLGMTGEAVLAGPDGAGSGADGRYFVLPATAIFHQGANPAVWVISPKDSTLELRPITASRYEAQSATVIDGLRDGERVVLAGVHTVFAGEKVRSEAPLFTPAEALARPAGAAEPVR